jgi:4-hydroxy-tetrahydrodipicolinate synthase
MQGMQILKRRPPHFKVWSGDDPTSLGLLAAGAHGVISVLGNAFPAEFRGMVHAALDSNLPLARHFNEQLLDLHRWMYIEGNPAGVKAALEIMGYCSREVRLPLTPLQHDLVKSLREEMSRASLHTLFQR